MRLLFCLTFIWIPLLLSLPHARAADPVAQDYVVSGNEKFTQSNYPKLLNSLKVPAGTSLKIEAGVKLTFTESALFTIDGTVSIIGTQKEPVILTAAPGVTWNGIFSNSANGTYEWLTISNARNPLIANRDGLLFQHITFQDNLENTLVLGQLGYTHAIFLTLDDLTFRNILLGNSMGNEGVVMQGTNINLVFQNSFFDDARTGVPGGVFGVYLGSSPGLNFRQSTITHKRGCVFGKTVNPHNNPYYLTFDEGSCDQQHPVPIVFVPGYGTSINLSQLVQAKPAQPTLTGWRFFQGVTPAYTAFLQAMNTNHIPVTVAYYDWRLPAAKIVTQYLLPAIQAAKAATGSSVVNIVAHSFGGLVARQYIQSNTYTGDVLSLTEVGTPNLGAAKAYQVWEGGQIPADWQALSGLINYYKFMQGDDTANSQDIIQKYFPSAQEMLPAYPGLFRNGMEVSLSDLFYQNTLVTALSQNQNVLSERVQVRTITSGTEPTTTILNLGKTHQTKLWRDGDIISEGKLEAGDGTVPQQSSLLPNVQNFPVAGTHPDLMAKAAEDIVETLYSSHRYQPLPTTPYMRSSRDMLWFFFDCPVTVTIALPDGTSRSSADADSSDDSTVSNQVGNVAVTPEMTWMVVPAIPGDYTITIRALQDTSVRAWMNDTAPVTYTLIAGQSVEWHPLAPQPSPSASASSSPVVAGVITNSPSPSLPFPSFSFDPTVFLNIKNFTFPSALFFPLVQAVIPYVDTHLVLVKSVTPVLPNKEHRQDVYALILLLIALTILYLRLRKRAPP